jgi:NADPH:quinone reductase-like Zn-dependent oxidoreductase
MPRAVLFDHYGGVDVLQVVEVERPVPGPGQVLVRVRAASINPGEAAIREGLFADQWPSTFPSGEGSDLAGVVEQVGEGVQQFSPGDEVLGYTDRRRSHADFVVTEADTLVRRPSNVPWDQAGSVFVAGTTAYASVRAVSAGEGDTVVVSGAAGGVGSITVQLAKIAGATVIGLASETHHPWLKEHGVIPLTYGPGVADRIRAASGGQVDAFVDTFGTGYVDLAIELGVRPDRINTLTDVAAATRYGVKTDGTATAASPEVVAELAGLIAAGRIEIPIDHVYPLAEIRDAYRELGKRHTLGKIVLEP